MSGVLACSTTTITTPKPDPLKNLDLEIISLLIHMQKLTSLCVVPELQPKEQLYKFGENSLIAALN